MPILTLPQRTFLSFFTFNLGWWVCIWDAGRGFQWVAPTYAVMAIVLHAQVSPYRKAELAFAAVCALVGFVIDSSLLRAGLFSLTTPSLLCPLWLVCLWALMAITFESMQPLRRHRYLLWGTGAITGPLSYYVGEELSILTYARPLVPMLAVHAVIWALITDGLFRARDFCLIRLRG